MKRGSTNHRHVGIHGGRDLSQRQPPKRLPLLRSCGMMERSHNFGQLPTRGTTQPQAPKKIRWSNCDAQAANSD